MIETLFEDNHLLILNKPAGLLTQPAIDDDSLESRAKAYIKQSYNKPGEVFLHAAHRLDRGASGIVVFARTSKALSRLNHSIREGLWIKKYLACVEVHRDSCLELRSGRPQILEDHLLKQEYRAQVVCAAVQGAKRARLTYRCIKKELQSATLEIDLETGRYHQIRVQLSSRGAPILGDVKYGAEKKHPHAIALHHYELKLEHPVQKKELLIQASASTSPYKELKSILG